MYYSQGLDFCRRKQAQLQHPQLLRDEGELARYVSEIKQNEQQTLRQLYEPQNKISVTRISQNFTHLKLKKFVTELSKRRKAFQDTGRAVNGTALQEVEQEREAAVENEDVRQVKTPYRFEAYKFTGLHRDLETFALSGRIPADATCFRHAFSSLARTGIGKKFEIARKAMKSKLFVTTEFDKVVTTVQDSNADNFLRPVHWVLWSSVASAAVILIPEEAEAILRIKGAGDLRPGVHLMSYTAPTTRKMLDFYHLRYFNTPLLSVNWEAPVWLRVQLFIFAGGLYFDWCDYPDVCDFLGIHRVGPEDPGDGLDTQIEDPNAEVTTPLANDELDAGLAEKQQEPCVAFTARPLTFLQEWLSVRRRGQDFAHSPMGFLAQGKPLQANHPFFRQDDVHLSYRKEVDAEISSESTLESLSQEDESCWSGDEGPSSVDSHRAQRAVKRE